MYALFVLTEYVGLGKNVEIKYYVTQLILLNLSIVYRTNEEVVCWILKGQFTSNEEKL
jgi:hypothetical protein